MSMKSAEERLPPLSGIGSGSEVKVASFFSFFEDLFILVIAEILISELPHYMVKKTTGQIAQKHKIAPTSIHSVYYTVCWANG